MNRARRFLDAANVPLCIASWPASSPWTNTLLRYDRQSSRRIAEAVRLGKL